MIPTERRLARILGGRTPHERLKQVGAWELLQELCREYHVHPDHVLSGSRTSTVCACRDRFLLVLQDTVGYSLPELGHLIGRDHTSVLSAIRRARARLEAEYAA